MSSLDGESGLIAGYSVDANSSELLSSNSAEVGIGLFLGLALNIALFTLEWGPGDAVAVRASGGRCIVFVYNSRSWGWLGSGSGSWFRGRYRRWSRNIVLGRNCWNCWRRGWSWAGLGRDIDWSCSFRSRGRRRLAHISSGDWVAFVIDIYDNVWCSVGLILGESNRIALVNVGMMVWHTRLALALR